ncbi:hypothetical protein PHMEG_00033633 [Phytophthora megakarya]|uniref:Uncharacterized protein n=1 Tax=Phytophthora megakarya TaxID=4795 RepID=A0A225UTI8_9STRA|nr:hypothetical protein PHMEG_00033633 [Phytophthora megakarya]
MLISDDGFFEGIDASVHMSHSAAKLKIMWKEKQALMCLVKAVTTSGIFAMDVPTFCSANVYSDDEDDSTQDGAVQHKQHNRKRQKFAKKTRWVPFSRKLMCLSRAKTSKFKKQRGEGVCFSFKSNELPKNYPCYPVGLSVIPHLLKI